MATGIIRGYSAAGFVIAADGRELGPDGQTVASDGMQKIFDLSGGGQQIGCSMTGSVRLTKSPSDPVPVFDFVAETLSAARGLSLRKSKNLAGYCVRLARIVNSKLIDAAKDLRRMNGDPAILTLMVDGFYNGKPERALVTFSHRDGVIQEATVHVDLPAVGIRSTVGVQEVYRLFFTTDDPRFVAYRPKRRPQSLEELAQNYANAIRCYADPEIQKIDPKCREIGGHVHAATITPEQRFAWVVPPIGSSSVSIPSVPPRAEA